jgi:hypothetical protein
LQRQNAGCARLLNFAKFTQNLLELDKRIVFVGIVDSHSKLMHSAFREGLKLYADHETIHRFMSLAPRLTMDELEKAKPTLGSVNTVLVRFAKRVFILTRFNEYVIVVGLDIDVPTELPDLITGLIKTAAIGAPDLPQPLQTAELSASTDS